MLRQRKSQRIGDDLLQAEIAQEQVRSTSDQIMFAKLLLAKNIEHLPFDGTPQGGAGARSRWASLPPDGERFCRAALPKGGLWPIHCTRERPLPSTAAVPRNGGSGRGAAA